MSVTVSRVEPSIASVGDYLALMKPRVMSLVVFTALVGLVIAPGHLHPVIAFTALICIAVGAGAAGALNMWYDADIDALHGAHGGAADAGRPRRAGRSAGFRHHACGRLGGGARPSGQCGRRRAARRDDRLLRRHLYDVAQALDAAEYRDRRRRRRAAADDRLGGGDRQRRHRAVVLFLIIFFWTPPHFWALSLYRTEDYARAGMPMLPVVAGEPETRRQILLYTLILAPLGAAPWFLGYAGALYGIVAVAAAPPSMRWRCGFTPNGRAMPPASRCSRFSILYLFLLFAMLLVDRVADGCSASRRHDDERTS